ncbi:unnamed protein product [Mytilus edulis]|uniref:Endonuclease/exonuclease/phosphatase domain-containing protein n=1 Tax=Mytilus edulis TaxID=6550 RepID=A0A8S3ULZ9_MYTED|nr:unnamed protein product [Mytilus edulis]
MYETGKLAQVSSEMRRYNLHILGVSESRLTGSAKMKTDTGETVLYSGRDNHHFEGVAIILEKGTEKGLIEWKPQLQAEVRLVPCHDLLVVMGDLNAKVGNNNTDMDRIIGKHGCGTINDNGERLVELCAAYNLAVKKMKKWITPGTWKVTEERRHMNKKIHDTKSERLQERHKASYRVLDKQIKRMNRADKRAYMEDLAKQAEEAADKGEQGKIYKITREICGKFRSNNDVQIKDKHGRLLATEDDQKAKCAEHFKEVRNRPAIDKEAIIIEALQDLEINTNLPERQEIIIAIKALKNGKSPGQDNLNEELFKVDPELAAEILQSLFTSIWEGKIIPDDWTKGIIIKLAKKGALSDCNNWRALHQHTDDNVPGTDFTMPRVRGI